MGKPKGGRALADNEARRSPAMLRVSPRKLNLVADHPRQEGGPALADLTFSRKRIAGDVKKALESAIANAENNHDLDIDSWSWPRRMSARHS
jgi:large subunit ribosomal protein L22